MLKKQFPWARLYALRYPVQFDELGRVLDEIRAAHSHRRHDGAETPAGERIVGRSEAMQQVRTLVVLVARARATVLVTGESGTGKEVIAREIHRLSNREGAFVAINCGAIPEQLLESELFGHERGAFTGAVARRTGRFELAHRGTLFLDEIGDMPMPMQVKLLRVLQEKTIERLGGGTSIPVDVRLVAATHRNLPERIEQGEFREDLYYRLNVFPIEIPPLRDRPEDVPLLVAEMVERVRRRYGVTLHITSDAMAAFAGYRWPGNARELANLVERLAVVRPGGCIDAASLPWPLGPERPLPEDEPAVAAGGTATLPADGMDLRDYLASVEKDAILSALRRAGGVVQHAADELGMRRTTLVEKVNRYGLQSVGRESAAASAADTGENTDTAS